MRDEEGDTDYIEIYIYIIQYESRTTERKTSRAPREIYLKHNEEVPHR